MRRSLFRALAATCFLAPALAAEANDLLDTYKKALEQDTVLAAARHARDAAGHQAGRLQKGQPHRDKAGADQERVDIFEGGVAVLGHAWRTFCSGKNASPPRRFRPDTPE